MAVDEAILRQVSLGLSPPTLRLYAWSPPCLSLGRSQPLSDADLERLRQRGWELVRRPTGGRAILHTDELTYSVIAPASNPHVSGGVLASYRHLSHGLCAGLARLGVHVEIHPEVQLSRSQRQDPVCFEVPSAYEITVQGRKLVGSAQLRRVRGVLQHGTIPLRGDLGRICQVLNFPDKLARDLAAQNLRARAATLEELLGRPVPWEEAAQAIAAGFAESLNLNLETGALSAEEEDLAGRLMEEHYALTALSPSAAPPNLASPSEAD